MLSLDGFRHHLGMIEHETNMYYVYKHQVSLDSVETSKRILLENFIKQQGKIDRLQSQVRELESEIAVLRALNREGRN